MPVRRARDAEPLFLDEDAEIVDCHAGGAAGEHAEARIAAIRNEPKAATAVERCLNEAVVRRPATATALRPTPIPR